MASANTILVRDDLGPIDDTASNAIQQKNHLQTGDQTVTATKFFENLQLHNSKGG